MDVVARLGGDEFTVFATNMKEELMPRSRAHINEYLETRCSESGKDYRLTVSLGHVLCPAESTKSIEEYLQIADSHLYEQKRKKHSM